MSDLRVIDGGNCAECPFARDGKPLRPVPGNGPADPKFIVLSDGPGKWETNKCLPMVGAAGKIMRKATKSLGVDADDLWLDHMYMCRAKPGASPKMKLLAAECCAPRREKQLDRFQDKPILAMGSLAAQVFLHDAKVKISKVTGTWINDGGNDIIFTIHPAAFMSSNKSSGARAPDLQFWGFLFDMAKVAELADGNEEIFFKSTIHVVESQMEASYIMDRFARMIRRSETKMFALDLETKGSAGHDALEQAFAKITTLGLATASIGFSFPWRFVGGKERQTLKRLLGDPKLTCVFHNRVYDQPVLEWRGFPVKNKIDCTMLMHHAAFPGLSHNLQRVTSQFFVVEPWKTDFRGSRQTERELLEYNAKDTLATMQIYPKIRERMGDADTFGDPAHIYRMDNKMAAIASQMQQRGIPISLEINAELAADELPKIEKQREQMSNFWENPEYQEEFLERLAMAQAKRPRKADPKDYLERVDIRRAELNKDIGKGKFKIKTGSTEHVAAYLMTQGVRLTSTTPGGVISTNKEILEQFTQHDCIVDLLSFRKADKAYGTFIQKIPERVRWDAKSETWRLHVSWSVNKITGRWGSSNPMNAQNWPIPLRRQVEASPGHIIIGADFAQVDARAIALMSQDPFLLDIFERGADLHAVCATRVFPEFADMDPKSEKRAKLRQLIKGVEYGAFYGGTAPTLFATVRKQGFDVTMEQVGKMLEMLSNEMARVRVWQNDLQAMAMRKGYIEDGILGRRRYFPLGNIDMNVVYNFPAQSTASAVMDMGLECLMEELDTTKAFPIVQVHDAIYVESLESFADECSQTVEQSLEQVVTKDGVTVRFPAKAKRSTIWTEVS